MSTNEETASASRSLVPTQHIRKPNGLRRLFHPSSLRSSVLATNVGIGLGGGFGAGLTLSMLIEGVLVPLNMTIPGIPLLVATTAALTPVVYGISSWIRTGLDDEAAIKKFTDDAKSALEESLRGKDDAELRTAAQIVVNSSDRISEEVRRRTIMKIAAIQRAYHRSFSKLGTASKENAMEIRNEAVRAVAAEAVRERTAIIEQARENDLRGAGGAIEDLRSEISGLLSIGTPKNAPFLIPHTGTGRAHIDRLISKAEEALALDPDMTDRQGARVDAAIHEHLPRLLQRHADTAKQVRVEDLAETDRMLDEGVELIRLSVEEGLEGLRHEKADALRTEIAFLRLRRGGSDGFLNPIPEGRGR
jgi:hypothetical protein